ncbi:MAG: bifunctional adenosylcobinamide kinase/adenosylcobinamide-phosphate guanylyltransferase [Paenibacillaceae bacterium]
MIGFISGGARSGKSAYAEQRAKELYQRSTANHPSASLIYLATAVSSDEEMAKRINIHQEGRGEAWKTIEEPLHIAEIIRSRVAGDVILLDCLTLWLNFAMFQQGLILKQLEPILLNCIQEARNRQVGLLIVSNDLHEGVPNRDPYIMNYVRTLQKLHQILVCYADEVVQVIAGIPIYWKGAGT